MFGVKISPVHFGRGLFYYSNFYFFSIDDKEETNLEETISTWLSSLQLYRQGRSYK